MAGVNTLPGVEINTEAVLSFECFFRGVRWCPPGCCHGLYYFRAKKCAFALPPPRRLQWLQAKDVEERSEWVTRFHWVVAVSSAAGGSQVPPGGAGPPTPPRPQACHFREGNKANGNRRGAQGWR